jgi:hypothetical protein
MPDYAREIFEEETTPTASSRLDYAKAIFEDVIPTRPKGLADAPVKVERHYEPTGEISAITGKPVMDFVGKGGPGASMIAHTRAGWVDNPITKFEIYSADRFPNLTKEQRADRYRWQRGELIFRDDNGKWYAENPDLALFKLKKMLAQQPAHLPEELLSAWGAYVGGAPLAFLGAYAGEAIRKTVGQLALGDRQTFDEVMTDLAFAGLIGMGGEIAGTVLTGGARKLKPLVAGKKARKIVSMMGKEAIDVDFAKAVKIGKIAQEKYGIHLWDAQTTESRRLIDRLNVYGDLPDTADLVQIAKKVQDEEAYMGVKVFFDDLSPTIDALYAGKGISAQAKKAIDKEIGKRLGRARPWYKKAFDKNTTIDIGPHIQQLDELIADSLLNGPRRKKLTQFRKMLLKKEKVDWSSTGLPYRLVPEDRIKQLDELKKSVDVILKPKVGDTPIDNKTKKNIRGIKDNILSDLDRANPDYQKAREIWAGDSEAIDEITNKTLLKKIADLEGDDVALASRRLLRTAGNTPEMMAKVKARIYPENPNAWNAAVRVHLEDTFGKVSKDAGGNAAKAFNAFWRNTVGTPNQAKILKVAMGEKYNTLETFADILRRVALIVRKESTTATRQEIIRGETEGTITGIVRAHVYPLVTKKKILYDKARLLLTAENRKKSARALLNPTAAKRLARVKTIGIDTEKGIRAFSTFLSLLYGNEFTEINEMVFAP